MHICICAPLYLSIYLSIHIYIPACVPMYAVATPRALAALQASSRCLILTRYISVCIFMLYDYVNICEHIYLHAFRCTQ